MFRTPSSIVVAGPSGCGKTYFVSRLLEEPGHYFQTGPPPALHYCYGAWQPGFQPLTKRGIHFHEGLPQTADLDTWYPPEGGLLILDDLMEEDKRQTGVGSVYQTLASSSHHRLVPVSRSVSPRQVCQNHFAQCSLRGGLQEPARSTGHSQSADASLSHLLASSR